MKSCPICSFTKVGTAMRCPNCQEPLTLWLNYNSYARQAYQGGLLHLRQGNPAGAAELLTQAVILDPDEPAYSGALGRVLGQLGRYHEAEWVLERAHGQAKSPEVKAAWAKAAALAKAPAPSTPAPPAESTAAPSALVPPAETAATMPPSEVAAEGGTTAPVSEPVPETNGSAS